MEVDSSELEKYIKSTVLAIQNGIEGTNFRILKPVLFNLAVTNTIEGGGGLKIFIAKAEGKLKTDEISHISFEVSPKIEDQIFRDTYPKSNPAR